MSDTPFMPLWVADFVGDTLDLDAKEVGAYLLILMTMWGRDGYMLNDERKLQRVARCGRDWPRVWAAIRHYFTEDGERITQGRLLQEFQNVASKRLVNSQSGVRGAQAKALKKQQLALANATVSLKQPEPYPEEIDKSISKEDGFEAFWAMVPKRVAKATARKAYTAALKRTDAATILAGMVRYAASRKGQDASFTAHPSSWLNADRWADETGAPPEPVSEVDKLTAWANAIMTGKDYLCRAIPASAARELVFQGKVTQDQCKQAGVAL